MSFNNKNTRVKAVGDANFELRELNKIVGSEIKKGIKKSDHRKLLDSINQKIDFLKDNPQYGFHIEKRKIPKKYVQHFEVQNLWKIDLVNGWRMIYTIRGSEIEILSIILDIIDHRKYDKIFGYRKR